MSIFVVSAPSGAGKTTLNRKLLSEFSDEIEISVSHTTRSQRIGEVPGTHYHFSSRDEFESMIKEGAFIEWAEVHGNLYGTADSELRRIQSEGKSPILEIDVQGWQQATQKIPELTSIFILPPSLEALWQRLESRGSDSLETRWIRFKNALTEIHSADAYQHFIINEDLNSAYSSLVDLIIFRKDDKSIEKGQILCKKLVQEFRQAEWVKKLHDQLEGKKL